MTKKSLTTAKPKTMNLLSVTPQDLRDYAADMVATAIGFKNLAGEMESRSLEFIGAKGRATHVSGLEFSRKYLARLNKAMA